MMDASFPKSEKLCGKLPIEHLYKQGKRFVVWPLRVSYIESPDETYRVLVWAPKSHFRHAVDRNRLRRLMREAYRLNKSMLAQNTAKYHIAFNYIDKNIQEFHMIEKAMRKALNKINLLASEKNN